MITFNQPLVLSSNGTSSTYRLSWMSDQAISNANPFRIYVDGQLISTQTGNSIDIRVPTGSSPTVEVLDTTTAVPQPAFPSYLELGWAFDPDAVQYQISAVVNGAWAVQATIAADSSNAWQVYATATLADETTAQWQVTPIDAAGNLGTPLQFLALMVRYPDVPVPTFTYNGSGAGTVTLS